MCQLSDGRRLKVHREQARGRPSITDGHGLATSTTAGVEGTAVLLSTQREPSFAGSGILCFGCDVSEAKKKKKQRALGGEGGGEGWRVLAVRGVGTSHDTQGNQDPSAPSAHRENLVPGGLPHLCLPSGCTREVGWVGLLGGPPGRETPYPYYRAGWVGETKSPQ